MSQPAPFQRALQRETLATCRNRGFGRIYPAAFVAATPKPRMEFTPAAILRSVWASLRSIGEYDHLRSR